MKIKEKISIRFNPDFFLSSPQGPQQQTSYHELGRRYGIDADLSDATLQLHLEEIRENLKREIRKELKIKEGAENLRKASSDKKVLDNVNRQVRFDLFREKMCVLEIFGGIITKIYKIVNFELPNTRRLKEKWRLIK